MFRTIGLNDKLAPFVCASRAPRSLCQELEAALRARIAICIEFGIRRHHPDQRHIREIMSFYNHLRADQDVGFARPEFFQYALSAVFAPHRIRIQPQDARRREHASGLLDQLLRAHAEAGEIRRTAARAALRFHGPVSAVVTAETAVFVEGQGHIAVRAAKRLAAAPTGQKARITAPVHKKHDLLAARKPRQDFFAERPAKNRAVALPQLVAKIHHGRLRRDSAGNRALCEAKQPILTLRRALPALDRGCRGAENQLRPREFGPLCRDLPRVIARHGIVPIGAVVLFVDDDESEIRKRRKERRTRSHHDSGFTARRAEKLAIALALRELGVDDCDFLAEALFQIAHCLKGQVDFRQQ